MLSQQLYSHGILKRRAKALIRLRVCAGWSEPLLVAHTTLLEISCHGSIVYANLIRYYDHCAFRKNVLQILMLTINQTTGGSHK